MKTVSTRKDADDRHDRVRRAQHLRDAIVRRAHEREHTAADIARVLDMSLGHWYRIRKEPTRLERVDLEKVDAIARYVGWPRVQVIVAIGWLQQSELDQVLSTHTTVDGALDRLRRDPLTNGLSTPIERAAPDHQVLMARLLLAAELHLLRRTAQG